MPKMAIQVGVNFLKNLFLDTMVFLMKNAKVIDGHYCPYIVKNLIL
mgnify:CR=1 FL=1